MIISKRTLKTEQDLRAEVKGSKNLKPFDNINNTFLVPMDDRYARTMDDRCARTPRPCRKTKYLKDWSLTEHTECTELKLLVFSGKAGTKEDCPSLRSLPAP
jgi:hypothetical protein